jgi:hypothetical protein
MSTSKSSKQSNKKTGTDKSAKQQQGLHTEPPISEKDEVKQAEERTRHTKK